MRTEGARRRATTRPMVQIPAVRLTARVHHGDHLLLWQARGSSDVRAGTERHVLTEGTAVWVPVGTRHALQVHENSVLLPMFFGLEDTETTLQRVTVFRVDDDLSTLFLACIQAQQTALQPDIDLSRQLLALIELQPAITSALTMPRTPEAAAVASALRANPGDRRPAAALAAAAHVSLRTIERAFVRETGVTLREWRIRNRMESAATLLSSVQRIETIAHRVGYTDVSAFRRVFKAHFGATPAKYRAGLGEAVPHAV